MRKQIEIQIKPHVTIEGGPNILDVALKVWGNGQGRLVTLFHAGNAVMELSLDGAACKALADQLTSDKGA